jgi:hypothetical protein
MTYRAKHPAAFINALSEGPKADAIEWLQRTWDELQDLRAGNASDPADADYLAMLGRESVAWLACHAKGISMEHWNLHSNRLLAAINRLPGNSPGQREGI